MRHHSHGQPVPLHVIAERQKLSLPFLEQIFNKLKKAGVVASVRGPKGGYILTRPCNQVSVGEVLRLTDSSFYAAAKEDPKAANKALLDDERMSQLLWNRLSDHISAFMEKVTFADLCSETASNTCPDSISSRPGRTSHIVLLVARVNGAWVRASKTVSLPVIGKC